MIVIYFNKGMQAEEMGFDGKILMRTNQAKSSNDNCSPRKEEFQIPAIVLQNRNIRVNGEGLAVVSGRLV